MSNTLLACYNNRAACYQQLGNYQAVVEDSTWVLEHDVGVWGTELTGSPRTLRPSCAEDSLLRTWSDIDPLWRIFATC